MEFLVEVVISHKINTWNGVLIIVQVIVYLGFKRTWYVPSPNSVKQNKIPKSNEQ
jgi:hypothetical protein